MSLYQTFTDKRVHPIHIISDLYYTYIFLCVTKKKLKFSIKYNCIIPNNLKTAVIIVEMIHFTAVLSWGLLFGFIIIMILTKNITLSLPGEC